MRRGEIWLINLDPAVGAEIQKQRPAVIISNDAVGKLPLKVIVPITAWNDNYVGVDWMVRIKADKINGLDKDSAADTFQIKSVSTTRFINRIGLLTNKIVDEIVGAINTVITDI